MKDLQIQTEIIERVDKNVVAGRMIKQQGEYAKPNYKWISCAYRHIDI